MKDGGVTIIATYVFWNHVEEKQGVFRWDGQRDLRRFLQVCKAEGLPVVLRVGPFCHGEARNGGIPDWVFDFGCRTRSQDSLFLSFVERYYRQIFTQLQGLQWKDGGPVVACQFDNEYRGSGDYLMALKRIATGIGFDLPFYTRTGWPELSKPVPFGEMIPLYGDYADGFWDRTLGETDGNYYKAFNFKAPSTSGENMGAMGGSSADNPLPQSGEDERRYPYFTCELGGGMATAYHRRPYVYPEDAYSMALVKLGSGSNLLGYYMYHGGTNPEGLTTLNEHQRTRATNYNDMPVKTYDFQAPLGEFGQAWSHYYTLRPLHMFMHDFGELLAPMEPSFPTPQDLPKGDDTCLRWAVRSEQWKKDTGEPASAFIFINNYERLQNLSAKKNVQLEACGVQLPRLTIPAGCMAILPVNVEGMRYATAQLVARRDGKVYLMQIPGLPVTISLQSGKTLRNVKPRGMATPIYNNVYLLSREQAEHLFLDHSPLSIDSSPIGNSTAVNVLGSSPIGNSTAVLGSSPIGNSTVVNVQYQKVSEAGPLRQIPIGVQRVAEAPTDDDFRQASVYKILLPPVEADTSQAEGSSSLLRIDYRGDVARLYADGHLVADNFYYGRPFLYGLWRLPAGTRELELRILPLQADAPIYLPREADKTPGEHVSAISIIKYERTTK